MKGKKKNQTIDAKPTRSSIARSPVVDAVVIHTPDFSFNLKLQNLLNYFLENFKSFHSTTILSGEMPKELKMCIEHLKVVNSEGNLQNKEVKKLLNEFIEEVIRFTDLLSAFCISGATDVMDPVEIVLSTKLSRLQWLAVCLVEELKRSFNKSDR
ncbi:MAG: hypothetical protein JW915_10605 [Chitinispirillaceae bacterium]|nr:hypothetical protein [Chitinispirillaceae bacterium]